ncbi:MAG: hypothetical protein AAF230_04730, partial [Pseudomonadota bacterium]
MRAFLFSLLATAAVAVDLPGEDGPEFRVALQSWLNRDDLAALEALSVLAESDNRAAQVLLARIAERAEFHCDVTGSLPRKDRIALLRQPGGRSGKSWLDWAA